MALRQAQPVITSNGSEYLVVWQDFRNHPIELYGCRVSSEGVPLDPNGFRITPFSSLYPPSTASNGRDYLVVWDDASEPPGEFRGCL